MLQPCFVAEAFPGTPGKCVKPSDAVMSFKRSVSGEQDELREQPFHVRGAIQEVGGAAEKMMDATKD